MAKQCFLFRHGDLFEKVMKSNILLCIIILSDYKDFRRLKKKKKTVVKENKKKKKLKK